MRVLSFLNVGVLLFVNWASAATLYHVVPVPAPEGSEALTWAGLGINDRGDVVGQYSAYVYLPDGGVRGRYGAFHYSDASGTVELPWPRSEGSIGARGINNKGQIAGLAGPWADSSQAYRYSSSAGFELLGSFGGPYAEARAINNSGQVTGYSEVPSGVPHAVRYTDGIGMVDIGSAYFRSSGFAINDTGMVAGIGDGNAVVFRDEGDIDLGPGVARGINNIGDVVGETYLVPGHPTAFTYRDGQTTIWGDAEFAEPVLRDINSSGLAVGEGYIVDLSGVHQTALFCCGPTGLIDLNTFLPENSGWYLIDAFAINDVGQIAGQGVFNGQIMAYRLDPIPEPAQALERCIKLVGESNVSRKNKQPLLASLQAAAGSLERSNFHSATGQLNAFQNKVRAQLAPDRVVEAEAFIKSAEEVLNAIVRVSAASR